MVRSLGCQTRFTSTQRALKKMRRGIAGPRRWSVALHSEGVQGVLERVICIKEEKNDKESRYCWQADQGLAIAQMQAGVAQVQADWGRGRSYAVTGVCCLPPAVLRVPENGGRSESGCMRGPGTHLKMS